MEESGAQSESHVQHEGATERKEVYQALCRAEDGGEVMLENGMIVGAESCDPQCREPQKGYCVQCKQMVPVHELTEFANGERVCKDCEVEYLTPQGADFVKNISGKMNGTFMRTGCLRTPTERNSLELSKPDILQKIPILYVMTIWKVKRLTFAKKMTGFYSL